MIKITKEWKVVPFSNHSPVVENGIKQNYTILKPNTKISYDDLCEIYKTTNAQEIQSYIDINIKKGFFTQDKSKLEAKEEKPIETTEGELTIETKEEKLKTKHK